MSDSIALTPVSFSRLGRRGVLLGLSATQLASASAAALVIVGSLYLGGIDAVLYGSPAWGALVAVTWIRLGGRPLVEWSTVAGQWAMRTARHHTRYRARVPSVRPAGTLGLPGDAAPLRQHRDPESGAVFVHDPHASSLVAVVEVRHPAFALLDAAEQERRVQGWGRVLATACRSTRLARIQVMERTIPDSGTELRQWWLDHGRDDGSWVADVYRELVDRAGPAGERHVTTVSLCLDLRAAARAVRAAGGGMTGAAAVMRQEMETFVAALRSAELRCSPWMGEGDLAIVLRTAYDPAVGPALERSGAVGRELAHAGPLAVEEQWAILRTDSAWHAVYWVSEWPRSLVYPGFLSPVLLGTGVRRSFSLVYDPQRADLAAREVRRRKTEQIADRSHRAKIGQIEDAAVTAELSDVLQQEADLAQGHGLLRYAGFLALSAPTREELDAACASAEQSAVQAALELRRLVGQQAQAFVAAALPLCRGL